MKTRRRQLSKSQRNRGSLPVNSRASITLAHIQDLEKSNNEYKSKIVTIELKIQNLLRKNAHLELKKAKAGEASRESIELAPQLREQIKSLTESIEHYKSQSQISQSKSDALNAKITTMNEGYRELLLNKNKFFDLKQVVTSTEQKLRDQRRQIQTLISNLMELNKKLTSLEAFEWVDQKKAMSEDIESGSAAINEKKDEIRQIRMQISDLQQKQEFLKPIVQKWKGKAFTDTIPIESVDELIKKLANKMKMPPPDTKDLQQHLQEIVRENERKREMILKERKENTKRIRKIQQVLVEVRKQNRETHEKANIEEQRLIQRILALKEEDS